MFAFWYTNIQEVVIPEGCVYSDIYSFESSVTIHKKTTVTLNANGGTVNGTSVITLVQYEREAYGKPSQLPIPVREGYEFLGWYDWTDGIEGNNVAESTEKVKYHAELRAKWCNHSETIVKNAVGASYTSEGYTGDICCKNPSCGKVLSYGETIPCKTLSAPKMSSVENVKNGLKVKWISSQDAKGYYVYCKKNGVYQKIATVENGTSYVDESVKNATGKRYTYKVCAYYDSATSKFTGAKSQIRVASTNIKSLKSTSKKTMLVQWKKVSGCSGYQIQYSKDKNFKKSVTTKTIKNSLDTYKKLTKLSRGKKQYVRVRSYKVVNGKKYYSAWSSAKSAKVK